MRLQILLPIAGLVFGIALTVGCGGSQSVNFGDGSLGNLVWGTFYHWKDRGEPEAALTFANKAVEVYGAEAREVQASLSDYPPTDPPEAVYKYKTLNDVGTILSAKGDILLERGDTKGAVEVFTTLARDYGYAQWQNPAKPREWTRAAELAEQRLAKLSDMN